MLPSVVVLDSIILTSGIWMSVNALSTFFSTELTSGIGSLTKSKFLLSTDCLVEYLVFSLDILLGGGMLTAAICICSSLLLDVSCLIWP